MDYDALSADLVRALRADRSQVQLSRWLGYRSNVVYTWESGRRWPTAAVFLHAAGRVGIDVEQSLERFYRSRPAWMDSVGVASPEGVAAFLEDLRGDTPIVDLAEGVGRSRFAVSRWLKGTAEPRLPDFLRLVEASSLRLLDLLATLTDPAAVPTTAGPWRRLEAARTLADEQPWAQAVLLALTLEAYQALPAHPPGWIAARLGIPEAVEQRCLALLADSGQIALHKGLWRVERVLNVDTRRNPAAGRRLKGWWAQVGLDRLSEGAEGQFSYNVFTVSDADLAHLQELHRRYHRAMRAVIAASEPGERVVVANLQLFALD